MRTLILFLCFNSVLISAQDNPVEYMQLVNQDQEEILTQTWDYLSSLARSGSNAKINQRRLELTDAIQKSARRVAKLPDYKGDYAYRDSIVSYLNFSLDVATGRTKHLIDLEKISQNSFDAMETYILYKKEINEKFKEKNENTQIAQKAFALKNNITLLKGESELANKISEASKVFDYKDQMYLSFFRCSVYETYMLEAFQNENSEFDYSLLALTVNDLADQSKAQLDSIQDINNDKSLRKATSKALNFFIQEAETLTPLASSYYNVKNEFEAYKDVFEKISDKDKTKAQVEKYNSLVEQLNKASEKFNKQTEFYNQERAKIYNGWNNTSNQFVQKYVPQ